MKKFNKNTVFLPIMLGGAFGSYICSTVTGKNNVHFLHPILYYGQEEEEEGSNNQTMRTEHDNDRRKYALEREERKIQRRKTMKQQLEEGHGLSDSHGGHWIDEETVMKEQLNNIR